ncbi:MAG: lipid A biosynthesis lauroyl acyltransferase, partial [Bdellovibrio sp.]
AWCFSKLPFGIKKFLGTLIGVFVFDILRIRRKVVLENLKIAFPEKSKKERLQLARRSYIHLALGLLEFFDFPFLKQKNKDIFIFHGWENYKEAMASQKGVCLLSLHLGNGDMGIAALSLNGVPLTVITKFFKIQWINDLWFGLRKKMGTEFIGPRNTSFAVLKALKRKRAVVFVMDQFTGPPIGCRVKFFGVETGAAMGLATLVRRTQAPVVPTYCLRDDKGKTHVFFEKEMPLLNPKGLSAQEHIEALTQLYTSKVEELVSKYPEQWMWLHRRWKVFRDTLGSQK